MKKVRLYYQFNMLVHDKNYKYYLEYCKLIEANNLINTQLQLLLKEKQNLSHQVNKFEVDILIIIKHSNRT